MTHHKTPATPANTAAVITIVRNGPALVSVGVPLSHQTIVLDDGGYSAGWRETRRHALTGKYSLCRCGRSKTPPFCDGSHAAAPFDGGEAPDTPDREQADTYRGPGLDLMDAGRFCAEARFCMRAGGIWNLIWRTDDPETRALVTAEAGLCPSGRLVAWDKGGTAIEPVFEPSIVVVEDPDEQMRGPLWVRGGIPVVSPAGTRYEVRNRVTLCRCGKSANQPFCDGSHCASRRERQGNGG